MIRPREILHITNYNHFLVIVDGPFFWYPISRHKLSMGPERLCEKKWDRNVIQVRGPFAVAESDDFGSQGYIRHGGPEKAESYSEKRKRPSQTIKILKT